VLKVEDWAEVRRLHRAEGMPIKAIARRLGIGRNTVRRASAADEPPKYQRLAKGSVVASWAGVAPGNNITGGKRGSGTTTHAKSG
jgi:transposase